MAHFRKCKHDTRYFRFNMPMNSDGVFHGNITVEGFGCMENNTPNADIDSIEYEGADIKAMLEILGGMDLIDHAAENHVASMFSVEVNQMELA